jgi:hypothetical protein
LDVVGDKKKYENIFKWKNSHPTKDYNNHEQLGIDFIQIETNFFSNLESSK